MQREPGGVMGLSSQDEADLKQLEEGLWRAETRFDSRWMDEVLAPDFFEFGRSGRVYTRQDTIDTQVQPIDARLPLSYFRARLLDSGVAQVTYVSAVTYDGGPGAGEPQLDLVPDRERVAAEVPPGYGDSRPIMAPLIS